MVNSRLIEWSLGGKPQDGSAALLCAWEVVSVVGTGAKARPPMSALVQRTEIFPVLSDALAGRVGTSGILI